MRARRLAEQDALGEEEHELEPAGARHPVRVDGARAVDHVVRLPQALLQRAARHIGPRLPRGLRAPARRRGGAVVGCGVDQRIEAPKLWPI